MELWDIYDANRKRTGRFIERGRPMRQTEYHLVVFAWIRNGEGQFLITKRTPNKTSPNMWETSGGAALRGEDSQTAVLREVKEEIGLELDPEKGKLILSEKHQVFHPYFADIWLFEQEVSLKDLVFQADEVCDARWATKEEIKDLIEHRKFVSHDFVKKIWPLL